MGGGGVPKDNYVFRKGLQGLFSVILQCEFDEFGFFGGGTPPQPPRSRANEILPGFVRYVHVYYSKAYIYNIRVQYTCTISRIDEHK